LLGHDVEENGTEAERWLKWSIEAGYSEAASVLGMAYATGKAGIKQNIPLACEVLSKAAAEARALRHLARQLALGGHGVLARSQHGESTDLHRRVVLPARRIVRSDSELDTRLEATAAGRRYRGDRI